MAQDSQILSISISAGLAASDVRSASESSSASKPKPAVSSTNDSVSLSFSQQNASLGITAKSLEPIPSSDEHTEEQFEEDAKNFEENLNAASQKEVQFNVSVVEKGDSTINFQVVEKESGKVIREFPPDDFFKFSERARENQTIGLLVDDDA